MAPPTPALDAPQILLLFRDEIAVFQIPETVEFEGVREQIDRLIALEPPDALGPTCRLDLGERPITLLDLRRLVHHLDQTHSIEVTGLYSSTQAIHRFAQRELKLKLFLDGTPPPEDLMPQPEPTDLEPASATAPEAPDVDASTAPAPQAGQALDLDPDDILDAELQTPTPSDELEPEPEPAEEESGVRTLHVPRTLRSGHAVSFDGDVTIFGDVNPGAQITAAGSVIVLGTLKGVVHAGATGDEQAFILCLQLQATQLRIGTRIAIPPKEGSQGPEVALVREGRIVIEPYRSRLPR